MASGMQTCKTNCPGVRSHWELSEGLSRQWANGQNDFSVALLTDSADVPRGSISPPESIQLSAELLLPKVMRKP